MAVKKRKPSKYNKMQKAVAEHCKKGTNTTKDKKEKAIKNYINDALKKGKPLLEAKKIVRKADTCDPFNRR